MDANEEDKKEHVQVEKKLVRRKAMLKPKDKAD